MYLGNLNWIAIFIATVFYFILGGFWFAPFAFQKIWDRALGFDRPKNWKPTTIFYAGPFIGCFIITIATAILINITKVQSPLGAIMVGFIAGVGYAGPTSVINAITPKAPHPLLLGIIPAAYHIVGIVIVSLILFSWR